MERGCQSFGKAECSLQRVPSNLGTGKLVKVCRHAGKGV